MKENDSPESAQAGRILTAFWHRERNFGDELTRLLLGHYGYGVRYADSAVAQVVAVGSILNLVAEQFSGVVLGTGFMWEGNKTRLPGATILAVRGRLTAERCGAPAGCVLGDPGLLVRRLLTERATGTQFNTLSAALSKPPLTPPSQGGECRTHSGSHSIPHPAPPSKGGECRPPSGLRYRVGIVPHYVDQDAAEIAAITRRFPDDVKIIDVRGDPLRVLWEIAACGHILSSSLHGLIAADSLGIPNRWLVLSDKVLGQGFKFRDYYSGLDTERTPLAITGKESLAELEGHTQGPPAGVESRVVALERLFLRLGEWVGNR